MLPDELETINANLASFSPEALSRGLQVITTNLQTFKKTPIPQLPLELTVIELIHAPCDNFDQEARGQQNK